MSLLKESAQALSPKRQCNDAKTCYTRGIHSFARSPLMTEMYHLSAHQKQCYRAPLIECAHANSTTTTSISGARYKSARTGVRVDTTEDSHATVVARAQQTSVFFATRAHKSSTAKRPRVLSNASKCACLPLVAIRA